MCAVEIALEILAIVAVVIAVCGLADKIKVSAPLLLLVVGVGGSYIPFIDEPVLSSEVAVSYTHLTLPTNREV